MEIGSYYAVERKGRVLPIQFMKVPHKVKGSHNPVSVSTCAYLRRLIALVKVFITHRQSSQAQAKRAWLRAIFSMPWSSTDGNWKHYRSLVRCLRSMCLETIEIMVVSWLGDACFRENASVKARLRDWALWVDKAFSERSAAKVFRFIKGSVCATSFILTGKGPREHVLGSMDPPTMISTGAVHVAQAVELQAAPWAKLWKVEA